jgi:23S rRNA (cytidine1920-2'-O)/16S rRNA (cytidine1409-2'-O)-methyltransferase
MRDRLDRLLVERGLAPSRERAQALILAARVLVDEQKVTKPGASVDTGVALRLLGDPQRYVSRGGGKLEAALLHWEISLANRHCADIGASTGGFTDCMLQRGAASVTAVDTGYGQIAQKLRADPRVALRERTNARYLAPSELPPGITFFAMDVSFISTTLLLGAVLAAVGWQTRGSTETPLEAVILIKPQFEAGREHVGKGGIVRDPAAHQLAIERVRQAVNERGAQSSDLIDSPILGAEGNREFLLYARF